MSQKYEKLKTLLMELFQLDQPDLDFGLYRVMHAKSVEVSQFIDKDLLPQVKDAFALYQSADKAEIEKDLGKAIEQAQGLGVDPETAQKVKDLRDRLKTDAVDVGALESEVYDHLFSFFRRYYSEGDFLAKRVYKPGVYAIPYEGEEVTLHWANKDQYYIKTSEYLRDYAFRLRPDDDKKPLRVHFRLVDATEDEHGNVKVAEGKDRVFILAPPGKSGHDFIDEEDTEQGRELVIHFEYRPASLTDWPADERDGKKKPPLQKDLSALASKQILAATSAALAEWIGELAKPHVMASGEQADYSRLEAHLKRYTARNTFDYFIHKDLGTFLRRELDFYIKNEIMHLDDVENESAPRVEQYLSKIKVIRKIAGKIIDFLAQLEDFQKKLWLKKKFVVETNYCITVGCIPEEFYPEIAANEAQREEWVKFFAIDEIEGDLITPGYGNQLKPEFLQAHPTLVVDTRHFPDSFVDRLIDNAALSTELSGVLFEGENESALRLIGKSTTAGVRCVYIDPPFNTGDDGFLYKDNYQHSSWCCLLFRRLQLAKRLLAPDGCIAMSIDQEELGTLQRICDDIFGRENRLPMITVKRGSVTGHKVINPGVVNIAEYVLMYAKARAIWDGKEVYAERARDKRYNTVIINRDKDHSEWRFVSLLEAVASVYEIPKKQLRAHFGDGLEEALVTFVTEHADAVVQPVTVSRSEVGADFLRAVEKSEKQPNLVSLYRRQAHPDVYLLNGKKLIFYSDKLRDIGGRQVTTERASDIWLDVLPNDLHNEGGVDLPKGKKPEALVARLYEMGSDRGGLTLDFFAGSGTALAAAQKLGRRWIGVEAANYFDEKPLRRMKNVLFGEQRGISQKCSWKGGGAFKYVRLESYEDALNNLETRRTKDQQLLLAAADSGTDGLREQYVLRYMLDVETRGSQSLLNAQAFTDPTAYKLKVKRPGSDESREVNVDLLETFNWLIGLTVRHIAAPQTFSAAFQCDSEKRLQLKGQLKQQEDGPHWFRTVSGATPDGRRTLVIWRKLSGEPEQDNLVLNEWFTKQDYLAKGSEFDLIFVNGGNNLENLKTPDDLWKVRLIEEDFHRLMFDMEGA